MDHTFERARATSSHKLALAGLSLAVLMPALATSSANVALPELAAEFGISFHEAQWIILSYLLPTTAVVVGAGRLGDVIGRRRILLAGMALFSAASLLCSVVPTLELLLAARVAQGVGAAIMMALAITFVVDVIPKDRSGVAVGLLGTMSAVGTMLGPALGGVLIGSAGARSIFLVNVPLGGLGLCLAYRTLPSDRLEALHRTARLDVAGLVLLVVALTASALALTTGEDGFSLFDAALLLVALTSTAIFVLVERRAKEPLISLSLLKDPTLSAGLVSNTLVSAEMMSTLVVGPFYLSRTLGLAPVEAGLVLSGGPLVAALVGVPAGKLVDRFGPNKTIVAGLVSMLAGATELWLLPDTLGTVGYIVPLITLTAGYGIFQAANSTAVVTGAGSAQRGVVSGLLSLSRNVGLITGASALGTVFVIGAGAADMMTAGPQDIAGGTRLAFAVGAALIVMATLLSLHSARSSAAQPTLLTVGYRRS